jgi:integrase
MRWGELMGLRVGDFEADFNALRVQKTVIETRIENTGNGTPFMWKDYPKGYDARRIVLTPLASEAMQTVVDQRKLEPTDRMFSMPTRLPRERRVRMDLSALDLSSLSAVEFNGRVYSHGTVNCYQVAGCRCDACRQASADYRYSRLSGTEKGAIWTPRRTTEWPEGLPISKSFWRSAVWLPANGDASLEVRRFHDLRASHISWLLAVGLDLPTVMARAGHKGFETTQRYTKELNESDDRVLRAMRDLRASSSRTNQGPIED